MKTIDAALIADLKRKASQSPRLRANYNLHTSVAEASRFLNVGTSKTYWRPHMHENKWEAGTLLEGRLGVLRFDDSGNVLEKVLLDCSDIRVVEVEPQEWHAIVPLSAHVVLFETKKGPYVPETDKVFAPWAPAEGSPNAQAYLQKLKRYFT